MITLSPKALRFADRAASDYIRAAPAADRHTWERWHADVGRTPSPRPLAGMDSGVAVPERVARILLSAVERSIDELRDRRACDGDEDGDIGNDIAFLGSVRTTLIGGLERRRD